MSFKFHEVHDVESIQKRCEEKESRRLQKSLQRVQKSSKNLQRRLNLPCEVLQLSQSQDTQSAGQTCNVDNSIPPEDSEPFMTDTASNASDTRALIAPTTSSHIDGQGDGRSCAPLGWGHGIAHGYGGADLWPHDWASQCHTGDVSGWPTGGSLAAYSCLDDTHGRPGLAHVTSMSPQGVLDGIATHPAQTHDPLHAATEVTSGGASLDLWDGRVAMVEPAEPTTTPSSTESTEVTATCINPRAQSEATTVITSPIDPTAARMEVLIKAFPPQDATEYTVVPDYPTPSSDCNVSEKSAKPTAGPRKQLCNSVSKDIKPLQEAHDINGRVHEDLRRAKRHCSKTDTDHSPSNHTLSENTASPSPDLNGLLARTTNSDGSQLGSVISNSENRRESSTETLCTTASPTACSQSFDPRSPRQALSTASGQFASVDTHKACANCGLDRERLLRLCQDAIRWARLPSNASLEDLLMNETTIRGEVKEMIMLRLAFGALRDYILAPPCGGDGNLSEPQCHVPHLAPKIVTDEASNADRATPFSASLDLDEAPHATRDSGEHSDNESETRDASSRGSRGQRGRWTPRDDALLRAYVLEDLDWSEIAKKLGRSESGVQQHWRIMESRDKGRRGRGRGRSRA